MIRTGVACALGAVCICAAFPAAFPAGAQEPSFSLEQRTLLRCAATAAIVAQRQQAGDAAVSDYPDMRERGREFFIRASVQVLDETGTTRERVEAALVAEARDIANKGTLPEMMSVCLPLVLQTR